MDSSPNVGEYIFKLIVFAFMPWLIVANSGRNKISKLMYIRKLADTFHELPQRGDYKLPLVYPSSGVNSSCQPATT
jgi:hypothetical protein